jgi:hypothetical protein
MTTSRCTILLLLIGLGLNLGGTAWAKEDYEKDTATGLPAAYAKNYLVARSTMSPDKKFAVIYPTLDFSESKEAADILVALKPFSVLAKLPADDLYFQNRSNAAISADWAKDGSAH